MGASFTFATYFGGSRENVVGADEYATTVDVGADGTVFLAGLTDADDFPVQRAFQPVMRGGREGWLASITPDGQSVRFSTYLGGQETDVVHAIEARSGGILTYAGESNSFDIFLGNGPQRALGSHDISDGTFGWVRFR